MRIPPAHAERAYYQRSGPGEQVGNMPIVGDFICKLTTLFGPPDAYVPLFHHDPPVLGFPLQHVATGTVIVPFPKSFGYAAFDTPHLAAVAQELDALLAATKPADCAYTFWSWYRVNEAGVRGGKPFFEHLGLAKTLDMRLAQFAENDARGGDRAEAVERDLCVMTRQNWAERTLETPDFAGELASYPHQDVVRERLVRCLMAALAELENDAATDGFDADAAPHDAQAVWEAFEDLELDDAELARRITRVRARVKRGHLR